MSGARFHKPLHGSAEIRTRVQEVQSRPALESDSRPIFGDSWHNSSPKESRLNPIPKTCGQSILIIRLIHYFLSSLFLSSPLDNVHMETTVTPYHESRCLEAKKKRKSPEKYFLIRVQKVHDNKNVSLLCV